MFSLSLASDDGGRAAFKQSLGPSMLSLFQRSIHTTFQVMRRSLLCGCCYPGYTTFVERHSWSAEVHHLLWSRSPFIDPPAWRDDPAWPMAATRFHLAAHSTCKASQQRYWNVPWFYHLLFPLKDYRRRCFLIPFSPFTITILLTPSHRLVIPALTIPRNTYILDIIVLFFFGRASKPTPVAQTDY